MKKSARRRRVILRAEQLEDRTLPAGGRLLGQLGNVVGGGDALQPRIASATLAPSLDIDENGAVDALSDGLLALRYMFGFTGPALTAGVVDPHGARTDPAAIKDYLDSISS